MLETVLEKSIDKINEHFFLFHCAVVLRFDLKLHNVFYLSRTRHNHITIICYIYSLERHVRGVGFTRKRENTTVIYHTLQRY